MSKIHASCLEWREGRTGDAWTCRGPGWAGVLLGRKLLLTLGPCFLSPSPIRRWALLSHKEGEENESSLNKNSKGHFYVWAGSQPCQGGASEGGCEGGRAGFCLWGNKATGQRRLLCCLGQHGHASTFPLQTRGLLWAAWILPLAMEGGRQLGTRLPCPVQVRTDFSPTVWPRCTHPPTRPNHVLSSHECHASARLESTGK